MGEFGVKTEIFGQDLKSSDNIAPNLISLLASKKKLAHQLKSVHESLVVTPTGFSFILCPAFS